MKKTLAQIEKGFWWKRIDADNEDFEGVFEPNISGPITQPNILIWDWDFGRDFAAFAYELARRSDRKMKLRPYPKLSAEESQFLFRAFGERKGRKVYAAVIRNLDDARPLEPIPGYSKPSVWKLDAPKGTLLKSFAAFIKQEQSRQGITPRIKPGETNKPPPWHYIELLDKVDLAGRPACDNLKARDPERTLRTARKDCADYLVTFKERWKKEVSGNANLKACLWPELERLLSE